MITQYTISKTKRYIEISYSQFPTGRAVVYLVTMTMDVESAERKNTWREHFPDGDLWVFGYG